MRVAWAMAALMLAGSGAVSAQSQLSVAGQPYFGGNVTLSVSAPADIGKPVLLAYGLNPLPLGAPVGSSRGPFFIGQFLNVLAPGTVGSNGRVDLPIVMPAYDPVLEGIQIALQAYVLGDPALSNPATLPLESSYYVPAIATLLESANPTNVGKFGDKLATGDLNGDGHQDVVVGAWFEDAGGVDRSGRVYIFWGPTFTQALTLEPSIPKSHRYFGLGLAVAELDNDGVDDLVIGEATGEPPPPGQTGSLHVYYGGDLFPRSPTFSVPSSGTGAAYSIFGRVVTAGDFNADGNTDIAVALPGAASQGFTNAGIVEVYWGPTFATILTLSSPEAGTDDYFCDKLAAADVNGDGITDLVAGDPRDTVGGVFGIGRVYLFAGPSLLPLKTIENPLPEGPNSRFGNEVVGRDIDGDGVAEVVSTDERNHGYIFWSRNFDQHQLITRPPDAIAGSAISVSFGYFAAVGHANADDWNDVVITEPFAGAKGRALIALGPYYSNFHVLQDKVPATPAEFGWSVHMSDLDGDNRVELLVGSDLATALGVLGAGHVTVFDFNP